MGRCRPRFQHRGERLQRPVVRHCVDAQQVGQQRIDVDIVEGGQGRARNEVGPRGHEEGAHLRVFGREAVFALQGLMRQRVNIMNGQPCMRISLKMRKKKVSRKLHS